MLKVVHLLVLAVVCGSRWSALGRWKTMNDIKDVDRRTLRCYQSQEHHELRFAYLLDQFNNIVNIKQVILTANFSLSEKHSRYQFPQRQLTFSLSNKKMWSSKPEKHQQAHLKAWYVWNWFNVTIENAF